MKDLTGIRERALGENWRREIEDRRRLRSHGIAVRRRVACWGTSSMDSTTVSQRTLVMGVVGAKGSSPMVLLTGFAGLLAARREQEVRRASLGLGTRRTRVHARRGAIGGSPATMRIAG